MTDRGGNGAAGGGLHIPYREREESISVGTLDTAPVSGTDAMEDRETELLTINLGPHHPATHGVLRLLCTLEGEVVRDIQPSIGYVHTGIEKSC
ncbi:hypothetical protein BH20ACT19_BH20ACT19_03130 [soil metagenome]